MKIKNISFLAFLLMLQACCCNDEYYSYELTDLNTSHLNNEGRTHVESDGAPIPAQAYGLQLNFSKQESTLGYEVYTNCARDCGSVMASLQNPIDSLQIITLTDFDSLHPSGTDVTSYFRYLSPNSFEDQPIPQYINLNNAYETDCCMQLNLFLYDLPLNSDTFQFLIRAHTWEELFTVTTEPVVLTLN